MIGVGSKIQLRTGAPSLTASGTLLYEFDAEAVPSSSGGSATITSADPTNDALADGTIGHIRITGTDGTTGAFAGTVSLTTGDYVITAASLAVVTGQPHTFNGFTVSEAAASA